MKQVIICVLSAIKMISKELFINRLQSLCFWGHSEDTHSCLHLRLAYASPFRKWSDLDYLGIVTEERRTYMCRSQLRCLWDSAGRWASRESSRRVLGQLEEGWNPGVRTRQRGWNEEGRYEPVTFSALAKRGLADLSKEMFSSAQKITICKWRKLH